MLSCGKFDMFTTASTRIWIHVYVVIWNNFRAKWQQSSLECVFLCIRATAMYLEQRGTQRNHFKITCTHCCLEHAGMFLCQFGFMVLYNTALIKYLKNNRMLTSCTKFNDGIQKLLWSGLWGCNWETTGSSILYWLIEWLFVSNNTGACV